MVNINDSIFASNMYCAFEKYVNIEWFDQIDVDIACKSRKGMQKRELICIRNDRIDWYSKTTGCYLNKYFFYTEFT